MEYHILHDFRTSTSLKKTSSDNFKDLHNSKLLTKFDTNPTPPPGGVVNLTFNTLFITPPGDEVRQTAKFIRSFS